jgi:hypothetical protein
MSFVKDLSIHVRSIGEMMVESPSTMMPIYTEIKITLLTVKYG